jgi:hypothetical protein
MASVVRRIYSSAAPRPFNSMDLEGLLEKMTGQTWLIAYRLFSGGE